MKENYKSLVKKSEDFTEEEERNILFLFKHKFFARWLSLKLIDYDISIIYWLTMLMLFSFVPGVALLGEFKMILGAIQCFIISLVPFIGLMFLGILSFTTAKFKTEEEERDFLSEKTQNLWLLNRKVISHKDWRKIKKVSKENYSLLRSKKVDGESFGATFYLANCIKNEKLKIIWLVEYSIVENRWFGRAVLEKEGYVYDSNLRRTYKLSEYFEATQAEKISEFTLEDYKETMYGPFTHQSLEKFPEEFKKLRTVLKTKKEK